MKPRARNTVWLAGAMLAACLGGIRAEIIDRIAVSVGNQVITEDQIKEEIRVTAFLNHETPVINAAEKRKAAERLIEQTLIRREIDFSRYPVPGLADADQSLRSVKATYGSAERFQKELQECGITEEELRGHLWWQLAVLSFIDIRFRTGILVKEADLKAAYDAQVEQWRQQGVTPIPSFDDSRPKMEEALVEQRINQALDRWLGDVRTQLEIRYHPGAFE